MADEGSNPVAAQEPTVPAPADANPTQTNPAPAAPASEGEQPLIQPEGGTPKTEEGDAPLINPGQKEPAKPEGAPEKYDAFNVPEGFRLDDARMGEATNLFKELNLTQGNAQKVIDAYCKMAKEQQTAQENQLMETRKTWRSEIRARQDFREQMALAQKGVRLLITTDAQRKLFTDSWLQDAPELFDLFVTAGKLVAEDNMAPAAQTAQPTEAQINMSRFPNL